MAWTDFFDFGVQLFNIGYDIYKNNAAASAAADAAGARAALTAESAFLQAQLLREQGLYYEKVGEFNARIYDQQAEVAIDLANREVAIIGHNATIQKTQMKRQFSRVQSQVVAAVGASGVELEGSAVYVMLDNAAEADYGFAVHDWATTVAQENRELRGDLESWQAKVGASKERYMGQLNKALKFREAALTEEFGLRAAEAERSSA